MRVPADLVGTSTILVYVVSCRVFLPLTNGVHPQYRIIIGQDRKHPAGCRGQGAPRHIRVLPVPRKWYQGSIFRLPWHPDLLQFHFATASGVPHPFIGRWFRFAFVS